MRFLIRISVYLICASLGSYQVVFFERIPIFSAAEMPWNYAKPFACQNYFFEISRRFASAGIQIVEKPEKGDDFCDLSSIVSFDLYKKKQLETVQKYPLSKRVLILWEPPTVLPDQYANIEWHEHFAKVLTMMDDLVDNQKYFKYYYPQENLKMIDNLPAFEDKKLCTQISSNKWFDHPGQLYGERQQVILFFEKVPYDDFDFYGTQWPQGYFKNYKGTVKDKTQILKNYRFSFCYENCHLQNGYISEKIFDCFRAGCVPIYWGCENITDYIPENCFIDRRKFANTYEVYVHIKMMSKEEHAHYLENIRAFLASPAAHRFSQNYFIECLARLSLPDYQRQLLFNEQEIQMLAEVDLIECNRLVR